MLYFAISILATFSLRFSRQVKNSRTILVRPSLDDQTRVDSKPAGQPKHASLNQSQIIPVAANRPIIGALGTPAGGGDKVSQLCNRCESPDCSLFQCDLAPMAYLVLLA